MFKTDGELLPPYVIYKSADMWSSLIKGDHFKQDIIEPAAVGLMPKVFLTGLKRTLKLGRDRELKKIQDKKNEKPEGEEEENAGNLPSLYEGESDDKTYLESLREELAEDKREEKAITHNTIGVGDYILVRFATKRTVKHYVGEAITHLSATGYEVNF
ncbi:hypothetical protein ILUMI_13462 [Ignelater luminosus]|uniref:Uncharacterized protein n=1 Tax=Ignelater luminosus TaxID=2038154 RepID=A0A8K0GAW5_IGNLU|nr:hypothetical protein ILUMI_13462 [Ignelater luminosus]